MLFSTSPRSLVEVVQLYHWACYHLLATPNMHVLQLRASHQQAHGTCCSRRTTYFATSLLLGVPADTSVYGFLTQKDKHTII